jgi:ceramide glucosyltransferase
MSSEFMPGVLVAWALEGMKFALGPTMAVRRGCLQAIGGFAAMQDYLADDFVLGQWAVQQGYEVVLSPYVLDHQVLGVGFLATFKHRLRWARSSRRSRPWGYLGEGFTHPLAWAVALLAAAPNSYLCQSLVAATLMVRYLVTWSVAWRVLRDPELQRSWWLVPLQDLVGFAVWCGGFTGSTVTWRGAAFEVATDGRFRQVAPAPQRMVARIPVLTRE